MEVKAIHYQKTITNVMLCIVYKPCQKIININFLKKVYNAKWYNFWISEKKKRKKKKEKKKKRIVKDKKKKERKKHKKEKKNKMKL